MDIDLKIGPEITARLARDLEESERIPEQEPKVVKKISTLEHLEPFEIDEREHSEELKKNKDRQSELEQLRADVRALEMASRLKKAEEEEILELKRNLKIAAGRQNILPQAHPSKDERGSTLEDEFDDEKEEEELEQKGYRRRSSGNPHRDNLFFPTSSWNMMSNPDVPLFIVETTNDALRLIYAAKRGIIPRITRRLNDSERRSLIKSGAVFVFWVQESKIERWTGKSLAI